KIAPTAVAGLSRQPDTQLALAAAAGSGMDRGPALASGMRERHSRVLRLHFRSAGSQSRSGRHHRNGTGPFAPHAVSASGALHPSLVPTIARLISRAPGDPWPG